MADVTLFTPSPYDRTRQYRAGREIYRYFNSRHGHRKLDFSIESKTGILVLDWEKSFELGDVIDFRCIYYDQKPAANDA